jgi:hypothetical protein
VRIPSRYSITIKDAKGSIVFATAAVWTGMIGALQSLNYYASTADDLGAPAPLNPSATFTAGLALTSTAGRRHVTGSRAHKRERQSL